MKILAHGPPARLWRVPLAILADSMGRRRLLLAMIVGFSFSSVGCAFATDWRVFAFLQFIGRAFTAADEMISVVVVVEEVILKRRGWAVGLLSAFGVLGDGIAAVCYPLTEHLPGGWRALYALAVVPLVVLVWMRRSLKETGSFEHIRAATGVGCRLTGKMMAAHPAKLAALLLVTTAYYFPVSASLSLTSKFLQETHNYSRANVSSLFIGVGIFSLAGMYLVEL
ncbi:MAG: MFS transporter, partial [Nitrospira sp.]|nr:MFS transporter [Nitrospira sp.]